MAELIEAGVHLGHQTTGWKMPSKPGAREQHAEDRSNSSAGRLSPKEAELWAIINRTFSPAQLATYRELRGKAANEALTASEHEELQTLTDAVEMLHAERMKALLLLAALRGEPPKTLAHSTGLDLPVNG